MYFAGQGLAFWQAITGGQRGWGPGARQRRQGGQHTAGGHQGEWMCEWVCMFVRGGLSGTASKLERTSALGLLDHETAQRSGKNGSGWTHPLPGHHCARWHRQSVQPGGGTAAPLAGADCEGGRVFSSVCGYKCEVRKETWNTSSKEQELSSCRTHTCQNIQ